MKNELLKIITYYGIFPQLKYLHTEYFELDQAIINYEQIDHILEDNKDKGHIAEELADVMVMLKQIQYYYGITDEKIENIMNYKIDRQLERIKMERL